MTPDVLDRVRALDPVPDGSTAPSLDGVRARIRATERRPRGGVPSMRWVGPSLAIAIAAAVAVVFVVAGADRRGHGHGAPSPSAPVRAAGYPAADVPPPQTLVPRRGMRGLVMAPSIFGTGPLLGVAFTQCPSCGDSTAGGGSQTAWLARSDDAGRTWTVRSHVRVPSAVAQAGADVWANLSAGPGAGGLFVSHDGGGSWTAVRASSSTRAVASAIGGATAWSVLSECRGTRCVARVVRGAADASRVAATPSQPLDGGIPGMVALSAGAGSAFITDSTGRRAAITTDSGRSWSARPYPCPAAMDAPELQGTVTIWTVCETAVRQTDGTLTRTAVVRRSVDGGRHWNTVGPALSSIETQLAAATGETAWVLDARGRLRRTTDGGRHWRTVLADAGPASLLVARTPATATVVSLATRGRPDRPGRRTDLVVYRTTDGGAYWSTSVTRLPRG